jgi:glucose-1-phosphate adenylyltransferase
MDRCDIGRRSQLRRAILDKNVQVAPDSTIGYDQEADAARYFVTESGIVVVDGQRSPVEISGLVV